MGKDKLEHFIKDSVGDYESPINTDDLWANIQGAMPAAKATAVAASNNNTWKWLALGAVLLITTSTAMYYGSTSALTTPTSTIEIPAAPKAISTEIANSELSNQSELIETETESTVTDISEETSENTAALPSEKVVVKTSTIPVTRSNVSSAATSVNTQIIATNRTTSEEEVKTDNSQAFTMTNESNEYTSNSDEFTQNTSVLGIKIQEQNTRAFVSSGYMFSDIDLLDNDNTLADHSVNPPKKVVCPSFGGNSNSRGTFIGELQLIPMFSTPLLTATSELGEEWKARKEATESRLESFQINLVGRYQTNFGVYVQGGVGYGQIDEKFEFNSEDITVITQDSLPVIIILRPNGTSDTIIGDVDVSTTSSSIAETYNYHRMIELPFAIGYEFALNSSMGIYFDFGGSVNLSTFRKGYHIVNDVEVISFDNATQPVFKTSTGFKLNGGAGLRYYTDGGMILSVGPEFRYHTSNWIRDEHPLQLKYRDLGVRLAVGYQF